MKIGVIGAGAAGLAALKHSLDEQHECEVFEQTGIIGGTWNYTDKTGLDEFGLPIRSSMYQGLRTNLPKELMQFEGFPFSKPDYSYVSQPEVLQYIKDYATHFNLLTHIKFFRHVTKISPLEKGRWSVKVRDLKSEFVETKEFDAIFVCIGNYSVPSIPTFPGLENFKGTVIHSHNFRKTDAYKNRKVLVIGGGPSGLDIARLVKEVADNVIYSTRNGVNPLYAPANNIVSAMKPSVQEFHQHSVTFKDGTTADIDDVILCTGYILAYPFLSKECGIDVDNHYIKYLYKHMINVNCPTMAFIDIPAGAISFIIFGIQVRFFLAFLKGNVSVTKEKMMEEVNNFVDKRTKEGIPMNKMYFLGLDQDVYFEDLAVTAKIKKVSPVFHKLFVYVIKKTKRNNTISYRILNDDEFEVIN